MIRALISSARWTQVDKVMENKTMRRSIEDSLSLLAGVGVGTALMFLLDPEAASSAGRRFMTPRAAPSTTRAKPY